MDLLHDEGSDLWSLNLVIFWIQNVYLLCWKGLQCVITIISSGENEVSDYLNNCIDNDIWEQEESL